MHKYRKASVAGMFYPDNCSELKHYISHFDKATPTFTQDLFPRALIVPHAGYIYSGYTANLAYAYTASRRCDIERVVVIGPSHRVYIAGASIAFFDAYHTPCGDITIDLSYAHALQKKFAFLDFHPNAHEEHSTEVQMPFIHHYFKKANVVEIVYGDITYGELSSLINEVLKDDKTLIVISTDLSHFHTEEEANRRDTFCINAINTLDLHALENCEACGKLGVKALVHSARLHAFKPYFLDYRTSYARSGDASRVVGYTSFVLGCAT
ncbi:AmmeMemoRadiSam system protein B [Sulfurospirillum barnesii]|uniref:MEMO1 family protein Sulba_0045 n=1 Tax=Sulfurospirillum barnesii (strain ATCC 700032 / DSM 10660 / SES-3) TaxID=760154 RepID=I3XTV4_SULBS|nr:AmmeMemoRadiSam system protein B [Sulfurospirillum barnesii]AFL67378.1 putative dioxygenase [Sulfurospirillum barnesii SES-3]